MLAAVTIAKMAVKTIFDARKYACPQWALAASPAACAASQASFSFGSMAPGAVGSSGPTDIFPVKAGIKHKKQTHNNN